MTSSRIKLKPGSPDFEDGSGLLEKKCDMPDCDIRGEYKAPRDQSLQDYYYFCFEHVQEYNQAWNFFDGMSDNDVNDHMKRAMYGDRPTWKYDGQAAQEDDIRRAAFGFRGGTDAPQDESPEQKHRYMPPGSEKTPEAEAMEIMELSPPLSLNKIKVRYKELAKKYHPDLNKDVENAEDMLKQVNMAYTVLRVAYEKYGHLIAD